MKKFIMGVVMSPKIHKVILFIAMIGALTMVEVITYRETTTWLADEMVRVIQEDNSFLAQNR